MGLRTENSEDAIVGKHVFGNLYFCEDPRISDEGYLRGLALEAAERAGMTIHDVKSWSFGGPKGGVSVVVLVTESHVAIHSWTEYGYATVDVFTCGDSSDPEVAFHLILDGLRPKYYSAYQADRSSRPLLRVEGAAPVFAPLLPEEVPRPRRRARPRHP